MIHLLVWTSAAWSATIEGRVANRGDNAPVPEAEVIVQPTPAGEAGGDPTATEPAAAPIDPAAPAPQAVPLDDRGRFTVEVPDGQSVTLTVQSPVHRPETVIVTAPLEKPLVIYLTPSGKPGEIIVEAFRPTADISRHRVDAEQAYETPGTYDDAVRLVQALPGVNIQREYSPSSGDVAVRGSLPGDSRYFYDGVEVPYLYHFNQYASVFPASQLDSIELFPSTFSARYGDATGAVIEATSKEDRPDHVTGNVGINLVMVGADVRIPLPKGWWMSVAGRRSFQDIVGEQSTQYPVWPRFYDFSMRAEHQGKNSRTAIFASGSGDRYERAVGELDVLDPVEQTDAPALDFRRDWQMLGVKHTWRQGRLVSAVLHDGQRAELNVTGRQNTRTLGIPTRLDTSLPLSERASLEVGGELRPELAWIDVRGNDTYGPLVTREAPAIAWGGDPIDARALPRLRVGAYSTVNAQLGRLRLMPGLRLGFDSFGLAGTVEPRLAGRVTITDTTELRFATGRYQQRPETAQLAFFEGYPTSDGWQASLGVDQAIAGRLEISLDGFYKGQRDVLFQPINGPARVYATGQSFGGELTMRYRMRETFFLWGWFSAARSLVYDDGITTPTASDQPLAGGLVASWNILPQLNVAVRYRASSGLPYTGIDGSVYDARQDTWIPRFGQDNNNRMPFYQKIDVHLAYTFRFNKWSLQAAADLWIVPKSSAQLYPTWSYDYSEQGFVLGPTVVPLVGLRASF